MNTSKPKVSVLMPSLNVEKFIRQSVQSVVDQTLSGIEIICIDAGSTDGTLEVLEEFEASHDNVVLLHSPVKSYGAQMNMGLATARGEYIGIVETDDYVDAHAFENLYDAAKANDCDIVKANRYSLSENGDEYVEVLRGLPYDKVLKPVPELPNIFNPAPCIWSALYRSDFLKANGIDFLESPGASFQDTGFVYKTYLAAERVLLVRDAYLHYRIDNEGSSVKSRQKVYCVMEEFASIDQFLEKRPETKRQIWDKYCELRFRTYQWNATRLDDPEYSEFMAAFADEFRRLHAESNFSERYFSEAQKEALRSLMGGEENSSSSNATKPTSFFRRLAKQFKRAR